MTWTNPKYPGATVVGHPINGVWSYSAGIETENDGKGYRRGHSLGGGHVRTLEEAWALIEAYFESEGGPPEPMPIWRPRTRGE